MVKRFYFLLFIFSFLIFEANAQVKPAQLKANWIFIISENVKFPDYDSIDTIKICIYGKNSPVYDGVREIASQKEINGKKVIVEATNRISDLAYYNVVYIDEAKNDFIEPIYEKIKGTGTLLISYQNENQDFIMINLLLKGVGEQFQIQSSNLYDANIVATEKLLALGGTKIDVQGLYDKKVAELDIKEQELKNKEKLLTEKEDQLNVLGDEIKVQESENEKKSELIKTKEDELAVEQENAQTLLEEVAMQEQLLKKNQVVLNQKNIEIDEKQKLILTQNDSLDVKKDEIESKEVELDQQQKKIDEQLATMNIQNNQIDQQRQIIYGAVIAIVIFLILSILILRSYIINKRINRELNARNMKIQLQKDEITKQAKQLEEFNAELSKLSLVASKTDNSVIIMDKDSNFEWVNSGFTRLYGFTLQLLFNEKGNSLVAISDNKKEKEELVSKCIKSKKTVIYENKNTTRTGEKIWVQTALTPVLDDNDNVIKLIAIESNITMLKEQEQEIKQKNEELQMQKAELETQKELLEEVNGHISDSINYALTIQKAILPVIEDIDKYFDNFIIYLPRDIVSGDFYWFVSPQENTFFMAAVDCTGHGVPGAFMSLIASRMLDEIVNVQHIYQPREILSRLNKMIVHSLSQETTNNRDGMDMALVRITKSDSDKVDICFAGAKRPLIYYNSTKKELLSLKGNRRSIGGIQSMLTQFDFEDIDLTLHKNDLIYISSDGMIDQNDSMRKRFGTPRFMEILESVAEKPLKNQELTILKEFKEYKKDEIQRDDIIVWGVKL